MHSLDYSLHSQGYTISYQHATDFAAVVSVLGGKTRHPRQALCCTLGETTRLIMDPDLDAPRPLLLPLQCSLLCCFSYVSATNMLRRVCPCLLSISQQNPCIRMRTGHCAYRCDQYAHSFHSSRPDARPECSLRYTRRLVRL